MTRALVISTKYPFPTDDGKKTVLAGFLAYLIDRLGRDNVTYIVVGRNERQPPAAPTVRTLWIAPPGRMTQAWNALRSLCGLDQRSLQEALTYSPRVARRLDALLSDARPDVLLLDTMRMGQYFRRSTLGDCRRVLFMDDLFYLRFRRMLRVAAADPAVRFSPAGTFAPSLPRLARKLLRVAPLQNLLYRIECAKSERREIEYPRRFDRCLLMNPNEVKILRERCPEGSIYPIKPLLRVPRNAPPRNFHGAPVFVLFGSLRHPVYRASILRFLQHSLDDALRQLPAAKIEIVGDGADDEIRMQCARFRDRVTIRGFVQDISTLFSTACALLVPLIAPGGLKLKTLTALYYGLPILATDGGIDGIPLRENLDYVRENDLNRFGYQMVRLTDNVFNDVISRNAAQTFLENYASERVYQDYDELFGLQASPAPESPRGPARQDT